MNKLLLRIATFSTLTAALLLVPLVGFAAAKKSAAKPDVVVVSAIELGAPFADNAILQRQMKLPVWGWSQPGTKVTVEFAGQKQTAEAGKDGKWMLALDPLEANATPQEMIITDSDGKKVILKNLLVGEVWMASGQSNMQWLASKCDVAKIVAELTAKGELPPIREFVISSLFSAPHPIEHAIGDWKTDDYGDYSAIAFAFAHKLHQELKIPIGILNCSFSQTSIESWTSREGFAAGTDEYTKGVYKKILETDPTTPEHKAAWSKFYQEAAKVIKANPDPAEGDGEDKTTNSATPGNMSSNRDPSWMFNGHLNPVIPYAIRGCIWNQGYANMGAGIIYYDNLHSLIRGWRQCWNRPELPVYFNQFYCPNGVSDQLSLDSTSQMRLGTWLARDIPHTGMASQIDITGAIHYVNKTVSGQRLALHALKNQYGKDLVTDGPMFKSYTVAGDKVTVEFDFAQGGLVVGETGTNAAGKEKGATGFSDPKIIENGENKVTLFYVADENRVWYPACLKIDGDKVVVTSPKVKSPRGVAYATGGVGFVPNLYNRALLPMTPFIYYDNKLVTRKTWPDDPVKIDGVTPDLSKAGLLDEYRKMPLLSTQFVNNAVLQAGVPVTIWGSAIHDWGYEAKGKAEIKFSFAGIEKTIPVTPGMKEWQVTVPPMAASAEPKTLKVVFTINGEVAHQRVCENIVIGDVWYVASPYLNAPPGDKATDSSVVRVMTRKSKRASDPRPSRFSISVSTAPDNRFASVWEDAKGDLAGMLGRKLAAKTGKPVGIIFMQSAGGKDGEDPPLKSWISADALNQAPSLMEDYKNVMANFPGNPYYDANVQRYLADWKKYWSDYIPAMIATKKVPDGAAWGTFPTLADAYKKSEASQSYNIMVHSFTPASFKGIIFLGSQKMVEADQGASYGAELTVLANNWKDKFGGADPLFFYTLPSKTLAPKISPPAGIKGRSTALEIDHWLTSEQISRLIDSVVAQAGQ
ncbi:MAG: hypothetical protein K8R87_05895 [Verrucomicrobia bacterium]|nr:hypothetical protein [Verrucomicrobiota bacterium]